MPWKPLDCIKTACLAALILTLSLLPTFGQDVKVYVSSSAGDRITPKPALHFVPSTQMEKPSFQLDESVVHQEIAGFGASFLEAGMICLNSLDSQQQESVLRALFDPKDGAGFSAMKTVIAATDFMSAGPWYTYDETPGDVRLKHFSIQRDLGPNGLIPYIKRARKYGSFILQAPMDYPPDWMLVDVNSNQNVDKKYFHTLAQYYLRYLQEYQKNGIFIDYLSLFNEPLVYTKIPYASIRDLLKNDVGPLFAEHGVKTKIQLSTSFHKYDNV
jgi:glucosylceramidase